MFLVGIFYFHCFGFFINPLEVQESVEIADENVFDQDQGINSFNQFSMLTSPKPDDGKSQAEGVDLFGYVLYCPCMGMSKVIETKILLICQMKFGLHPGFQNLCGNIRLEFRTEVVPTLGFDASLFLNRKVW